MSWYEDERRADLRWAEPPEEPRRCAECRFCIDVGIPCQHVKGKVWYESRDLRDGGVCVRESEKTGSYEDMRYVDFGEGACDGFEEA